MTTALTETERKYEAPGGTGLPQLNGLPPVAGTSEPAEQMLEAEYFDTADLRLIRNGITLRRRRGGRDAGWHLKVPLGGNSRQEIRLPPGRSGRVPGPAGPAGPRVYPRGAAPPGSPDQPPPEAADPGGRRGRVTGRGRRR
jgi:CYTH domain-containing protein